MKRVVATLSVGDEAEAMGEISIPLMKLYAKKFGADFIVMGKTDISEKLNPFYEKMRIAGLLESYDEVLFLDIDILVTPWAENIFELVPNDEIGVVSVEDIFGQVEKQKDMLNNFLGILEWKLPYFNSGVFVVKKNHIPLLNIDDKLIEQWIDGLRVSGIEKSLNDQNILNYRANMHSIKVCYLDKSFNFTKAWRTFSKRFNKNFIHYAGIRGKRTLMMKRDAKILHSNVSVLYKKSPIFVRVADKIWDTIGML